MGQARRHVPLGRNKELFPEGTHCCLIFSDEEERQRAVGPYLAHGLAHGEVVHYFADVTSPEQVHAWLRELDVDIPPPEEVTSSRGQLELIEAQRCYCPAGVFVPDEMLGKLIRCYHEAVESGHAGARVTGEMTWALRGLPGSDRLVEYEARINLIVDEHPVTAVCQYDARRFDGATILDVLRVHPMMLVHGQVVRNPYYTRPDEFLRRRGAAQSHG